MNIFDYIENLSYKIAHKIGKNESEDDIELYEYSIFMIMSNSFTILVGLILSLIFGYTSVYIICLLTYILLRTVGGGQHCETFKSCFFISNIIILICCIITIITYKFLPNTIWLASVVVAINTIPICPKPSTNSPSRGYSEDIMFRKEFAGRLGCLILISLNLISFGLPLFSTSISIGILVLCFVLTDFGERLVSKISNIFN